MDRIQHKEVSLEMWGITAEDFAAVVVVLVMLVLASAAVNAIASM